MVYRDGDWRPAPGGVQRATFPFPEPPSAAGGCRPYPAGEQLTVPRHTDTRKVTTFLTTASAVAAPPAGASSCPYALPVLGVALRTPLEGVLGLLDKAIGALLPEGPDEERAPGRAVHRRGAGRVRAGREDSARRPARLGRLRPDGGSASLTARSC